MNLKKGAIFLYGTPLRRKNSIYNVTQRGTWVRRSYKDKLLFHTFKGTHLSGLIRPTTLQFGILFARVFLPQKLIVSVVVTSVIQLVKLTKSYFRTWLCPEAYWGTWCLYRQCFDWFAVNDFESILPARAVGLKVRWSRKSPQSRTWDFVRSAYAHKALMFAG